MRPDPFEDNPDAGPLLLAERSAPAIPRALIADAETPGPAVGMATPPAMAAWLPTASPRVESWRHWGINE